MAHDDMIPELDRAGLRRFGLTTGVAIVTIFGIFIPWKFDLDWVIWPWVVATALWLPAALNPNWLRVVYRAWMRFGLLASRVMTPLVLGIVFFVMIAPMAIVRRLFGSDPMRRSLDPDQASYRTPSEQRSKDNLERPF